MQSAEQQRIYSVNDKHRRIAQSATPQRKQHTILNFIQLFSLYSSKTIFMTMMVSKGNVIVIWTILKR